MSSTGNTVFVFICSDPAPQDLEVKSTLGVLIPLWKMLFR